LKTLLFTGVRGKGHSRKFGCRILYRETRAQPITLLGLVLRTGSDYDILEGRIKMRWRGKNHVVISLHTSYMP
jgi:hypothetical protein